MGAFEYVALDNAGKESKGLIEGDTPKHVRQILRDRSLLPVVVTEVARQEARRQRSFSVRGGMSATELAIITRQLASLSQSGLPLEEALLAVAQQNDHPRTKSIVLGVAIKGCGRPYTGRRIARIPASFSRALSLHGFGWRTIRTSRYRSGPACRLHRSASRASATDQ